MATTLKSVKNLFQNVVCVHRQNVRSKMYWPRAVHPEEEKTLEQRLSELNRKDPVLDKEINIGFPVKRTDGRERRKKDREAKLSPEKMAELEKAARHRTLKIPLDEVKMDYQEELQPFHRKSIAEHYGIFRDLFDNAVFYPSLNMDISYDFDEEYVSKVFMGNRLSPSEVKSKPEIDYPADPDTLWTLCLTAPDSHLQDETKEYLHWMVGNIPGSDINKGEELCNYLPPFPAKGTGYHRYIFLLYKQDGKIDFNQEKRPENCISLKDRTFSTLEFYRKLQDHLTPAGLNMFQSFWDDSVRETFWHTLDMKEPRFEFKHPPPYFAAQEWYPHKVPFNLYIDRYRDIKDLNEEVFLEKMKEMKPLEIPKPPMKYPMLQMKLPNRRDDRPSWLKLKLKHKYLKEMHWDDSYEVKNT